MAELSTTVDVSADSSPALEVPRDPAAYAEWRQTGKVPAQPKTEVSATSTDTSAEGKQPKEKPAPASEAGTSQEKKGKRDTAADRLAELLDDIRQTGYTPADLKSLRKQAQRETQQAEPGAKPQATEQTGNPAELKAPVKPTKAEFFDSGKFKTYDEAETAYEAARDKYNEDMAEHKATLAVQRDRQERAAEASRQTVHQKIKEAEQRYGAESGATIASTARTIAGDPQVNGAVKEMLGGSPVMADVLYTIGSKPEGLAAFVDLAKTDPANAIRKLIVIEQLVQTELAKGSGKQAAPAGDGTPERGEDGKFQNAAPPEKKESKAPPPPNEVSGRGTTPPDEVESAVKNSDFAAFKRAQNAKDLARRRG